MVSPQKPQFDVFLSHNSVDKPWVIQLKDDLLRYGVSVWLDKDEIRPGDLFAQVLEEALDDCRAVALVVSPEAMESGWVKEEYYRALSLTKDKKAPVQLVPVILRRTEVPGFLKSRNWVDFRDETAYAQMVAKLVWGITGQKPAEVLDLTAPVYQPPTPPAAEPAPVSPPEPPAASGSGFRGGSIKAKNIQARNVNAGVSIEGPDPAAIQATGGLLQNFQAGDIEASEDLTVTGEINVGLNVGGSGEAGPTLEQLRHELAELRAMLQQAIEAGEFADAYEAEDTQKAVDRAIEQAQAEPPATEKISGQLERAASLIDRAAQTAQSAGKLGATVLKLGPALAGLKRMVELIF